MASTLLLLAACQSAEGSNSSPTLPGSTPPIAPTTIPATHVPTVTVETIAPTSLPPTPTDLPQATDTSEPNDLAIAAESLQLYPAPFIVSGDKVTFHVMPYVPDQILLTDVTVDIFVDDEIVTTGKLDSRNWAGQAEGLYEWVWDTQGIFGDHDVRIVLDGENLIENGDQNSENNVLDLTVNVRKIGQRPLEERDVSWITADTDCCKVTILTRTAAYRDMPDLLDAVEGAVAQAAIVLREEPDQKISVFIIDRTIGQGGFAGSEMTVSYVDRPYAGGNLHELLVHEAVHVIDRQFAPERIKFLAEGVAVWAAGGHYKAEDLDQRAAALLETGRYIPLSTLVNDFYSAQHEIGYLEAGAFVNYLVDQFGYATFREFYSDTTASDAPSEIESLDLNLQTYYGSTLAEMEAEWLQFLRSLPLDEPNITDLETTIRYYEVMRRYQKKYDPTAHFLTAWLPNPVDVQSSGNAADLTRHPKSEINVTLEVMLSIAESALIEQEYVRANVILDSIERILTEDGAFADPLSGNYFDIVQVATAFGYEVQRVDLQGDTATVLATTASGIHLTTLDFERRRGDWVLQRD